MVQRRARVEETLIGVCEHTATETDLDRVLAVKRRDYPDTGMATTLVYDGEPAGAHLRSQAAGEGVRLISFIEYKTGFEPRFTDADVVFAPEALRKALAYAVTRGADHLVVVPEVPTEGLGERLFIAMFSSLFSFSSPPSAASLELMRSKRLWDVICSSPVSSRASLPRREMNAAIFDFELSAADMAEVDALAKPAGRVVSVGWAPTWD